MRPFILLVTLPALSFFLFGSAVYADGISRDVPLVDEVSVSSTLVCLGDLVDDSWLQSRCRLDRSTCCRWSLEDQRSKTFTREEIQREVSKMNLGGFHVNLTGKQVTVTQTRRELRYEEIKTAIQAALNEKPVAENNQDQISLVNLKVLEAPVVDLANESDWQVTFSEPVTGETMFKIISKTNSGQLLGRALGKVQVLGEVYVARRTIRPMQEISQRDFELRKADILSLRTQSNEEMIFRKGQFPEGVRARMTVPAGQALTTVSIEREPVVQLGDTVTLILRSDNLRISTKGVVQGPAAVGDMVTVQLKRYNKTFRGRLGEGRSVEVWL